MPRAQSASLHETPRLVREMSEEAKPFLNDVQRQALDAALAAKLAKLSGELHSHASWLCSWQSYQNYA